MIVITNMKGILIATLLHLATPIPECNFTCSPSGSQVCGTDGKSYDNECELKAHTCNSKEPVTVAYHGPCDPILGKHPRQIPTCYECNSGVFVSNPNCPGDGKVHDSHTEHRECTLGKCFVRDNNYYNGTVFRGCISDYPDLIVPIPDDGYHGYHSGMIYICKGDRCNGEPFNPPDNPPDEVGNP